MRSARLVLLGLLSCATVADAQQPASTAAPCQDAAFLLSPTEQRFCHALAQAVEAAQPQLGILIAGGSPTPGAAEIRGLRLTALPPLSISGRVAGVAVSLPDVRDRQAAVTDRLRLVAPALAGSVAVGVFPGFIFSPTVAGFGGLDILATATWLPFNLVNVRGLAESSPELAYGLGARLGLLRETFDVPAVSVSLMRHRLGHVRYGDVCPAPASTDLITTPIGGYDLVAGLCAVPGDPGEFSTDVSSWSTRTVVSKRLLGFGLGGGAGYDRFRSRMDFGLGASPALPVIGVQPVYVRGSNLEVEQSRWSGFLSGSYTFVITSLAAELGWMQGGRVVPGFDRAASAFEPRAGTWFGSLSGRVTF